MSNPIGDRNLLAGILAVQKKFISRDALVAALKAWTQAKDKGLSQILREQKTLTENQHALLEEAVYTQLAKHGNDVRKALAALTSADAIKQALASIADADLKSGVAVVGTAPPEKKVVEPVVVAPVETPKKRPPVKAKPAAAPEVAKKLAASGRSLSIWLALSVAAAVMCLASLGGAAFLGYIYVKDRQPIAQNPDPDPKDKQPNKDKEPNKDKQPGKDKKVENPPEPVVDRKPIEIVGEAEWSVDGKELVVQNPVANRAHLYFGSPAWTDYDLSFDTKATAQSSGPLVHFRAADSKNNYTMSLGAFLRSKHTLNRVVNGQTNYDVSHFESPFTFDQWYAVRIEVRGDHVRCFVDGKEVFDYKNKAHARGMVGFGATGSAKVRWKNIFVTSPDGEVLWDGPPELGESKPAPATEFVSLFNGKDLKGWKKHALSPGEWRVEDGILVGTPWPRKVGTHYLQTEKVQPRDFHLRVEMRVIDAGNAAVFFRSPNQEPVRGYSTMVYQDGGTPPASNIGTINRLPPGQAGTIAGGKLLKVPASDWFTLEIVAEGKHLVAKVNGQTTHDCFDETYMAAGEIVLAQMGPHRVEFRKIEIKELKEAPPIVVQNDFVPLFNGKDLTGWKIHKRHPGDWRVENGHLVSVPYLPQSAYHLLQSEKEMPRDFHLRVEMRIVGSGGAAVYYRTAKDDINSTYYAMTSSSPNATFVGALGFAAGGRAGTLPGGNQTEVPNKDWFTLEIIAQGNHLTAKVNGRTTHDCFDEKHSNAGDIILRQMGATRVEFRKIEIKELKDVPPVVAVVPKEFIPLFNGKDLLGWRKHPVYSGDWRVENGLLIGSAGPRNRGRLECERIEPKDFHLRVEARLTKGNSLGNVFFRSAQGGNANYESPIGTHAGGLMYQWPGFAFRSFPFPVDGPIFRPQPGEWFTLEIIAKGQNLTTKVDGIERINVMDANLAGAGPLGLTLHSQSDIEFRKIDIKPLDGTVVAAPMQPVGPATPGFASLFNGKDLAGWKNDQQLPGKWSVEDGAIVGLGGKGNHGMLWTQRNVAQDFQLRFEAKITDMGSAYVRFRCPQNSIVGNELTINSTFPLVPRTGTLKAVIPGRSVDLIAMKESPVPAEQWAQYEITAQGKRLIVKVNDKIVADVQDEHRAPSPGHIGLASANGTISFRKLELKELPGGVVLPPPPPAVIADAAPFPIDAGFVPLFNGKDLTGLKSTERQQGDWQVINGVLTASGLFVKALYTPRDDYGDFHLRAEMRVSDDGSGSLSFRYPFHPLEIEKGRPGGNQVRLSGKDNINNFFFKTGGIMIFEKVGVRNILAKEQLTHPGKWFNLEIIAEGNVVTTKVNGQEAVLFANPKTHLAGGRIVLRCDATPPRATTLEVRKLEIKEFKKVAAPPQPPPEGPLADFVSLFNGKDLDGWRVEGNAGFKVEKGELVGAGPDTALISKRPDYRSFIAKIRFAASADVDAYFAFRQNTEDGKIKGLTSRITGDGNMIKAGYVGMDLAKFESGTRPLLLQPGEFGEIEFHVRQDMIRVMGNDKLVGGLGYPLDRFPPGAIGLHIAKGTVRITKFEISAEAPIGGQPVLNPPPPVAADMVPLFNGKDLDGWKSNRLVGGWRVVNGVLTASGNNFGELYTTRNDYGDFHLRLEGRVNAQGNSYVMFRYPYSPAELARSAIGGYGSRIGGDAHVAKTGTLHVFDGFAPRVFKAKFVAPPLQRQWFTLDVIAVGNDVTLKLNGVTTASYKNPRDTLPGGRIVLGFGDTINNTLIEYRKIEIKEFKAVPAPPPPAAAVLRDWTPLFNGKDMKGLRDDGGKGTWQVVNGALVGTGPNAWILSERKDYKNFNARVEVSAEEDIEALFALRQHGDPFGKWLGLTSRLKSDGTKVRVGLAGVDGTKFEKGERELQAKPGATFPLEFQVRGDHMKVIANGKVTATMVFPPDRHPAGAIGFFITKGSARITKFEVAEEVAAAAVKFVPAGDKIVLFNGKDLTGWQAHDEAKGKWRVENGVLTGDGFAPGVLHTTRADFKDYHLRMEARFDVTPGATGAIIARSADGLAGVEARFAKNRFTGSLYLSGENFGKPIAAKDPASVAAGDWFTLDLFAQDNRILVKVNGKETTEFVDDENLLKTGRIALKHGANCKLEVRKAELQELKAEAIVAAPPMPEPMPKPEPMPVAGKGNFVPLFNGKDLDGWQPHAKRPGNWKVENGVLVGSAPVGGSLYSKRADYQDFHLRAEVRLNDKGFGRIYARAAYDPTKIPFKVLGYEILLNQRPVGEKTGTLTARSATQIAAVEAKEAPMPGDWAIIEVIARGDLVTVKVNGNIAAEYRDDKREFARSGHIALHQDANAVVEFRRVEIEDLTVREEKK